MISTQVYMHQAWDKILCFCFAVVLYTLHERTCTVTDSNNRNTHFLFTCHTSTVSFPGIVYLSQITDFKAIHTISPFLLDSYKLFDTISVIKLTYVSLILSLITTNRRF